MFQDASQRKFDLVYFGHWIALPGNVIADRPGLHWLHVVVPAELRTTTHTKRAAMSADVTQFSTNIFSFLLLIYMVASR
jgi:hypothetical protein